jgi:hypothetical protein
MINALIRSLILSFLIFFPGKIFSQDTFSEQDKLYGLDQLVYNGKKYSYFLPSGTGGTQYLDSEVFLPGNIVFERKGEVEKRGSREAGKQGGMEFLLNYDVYNQKLLLKYNDEMGAEQIIEASEAWLKGFTLGPREFILLETNNDQHFYQVLGDEKYKVLYFWRKTLKLINTATSSNYTFSAPVKTRFVMINGEIHPFGSKGSFIKLFGPDHRIEIRSYIQSNGISMKNSPDDVISALIDYISNLE